MDKILIVGQKPYFKKIIENEFSSTESFEVDSLQAIFNINDKIIDIESEKEIHLSEYKEGQNKLIPLKLNFFKDAKEKYVFNPTKRKINEKEYDYVLFVCDNSMKTLYSIIEYCERNEIPMYKLLYINTPYIKEGCVNEIIKLVNTTHFDDLSVDFFNEFA